MNTTEANTLAEASRRCLMASMDGAYTTDQQAELNANGKRLRAAWMNLVSGQFNDPAALKALQAMTDLLTAVNKDLAGKVTSAQTFDGIMKNVQSALGFADQLLGLAAKFV